MEPALSAEQDDGSAGRRPIPLRPQREAAPISAGLPAAPTPLLGRGAEVDRLRAMLWEAETRLLTLTGPGGVGKTRLALAAAETLVGHYADGVHFVDLAPVRDPALVPGAAAAALGVKESPDRSVGEALAAFLREKDLLLVLDNCEQVAEAAPHFASWLAQAPALVILATSRAPLRLRWERIVPVVPLGLPEVGAGEAGQLAQFPAVALFVERARTVRGDFALTAESAPAVAELCRRLDGLPLAIELVAIQVRALSPQAIVARLAERRDLPVATWTDLPERHRSLDDAISWSYELLAPAEQALFRRLAIFSGGWTLAAVEAVCGGDAAVPDPFAALMALVEQSLVRPVEGDGEPRYTMLETVREFAAARLEACDEATAIGQRHADLFLALAERADRSFVAEGEVLWLTRLEADVANIRAALQWYAAHGQREAGTRLASDLSFFWRANGRLREGYGWLIGEFAGCEERPEVLLSTRVQRKAGLFCYLLGRYDAARSHALAALALAADVPEDLGLAYNVLGLSQRMLGDYEAARESISASLVLLRRVPTAAPHVADVMNNLGAIEFDQGDYVAAVAHYVEAVAIQRRVGAHHSLANSLTNLAVARIMRGDFQVRDLLDESLVLGRALRGHVTLALAVAVMALLASVEGQQERTVLLLGAAEAVRAVDDLPIPVAERPYHERMATDARRALGKDEFDALWATGRGWSLDEIVAYARERGEQPSSSHAGATAPPPTVPVAITRREREVLAQLVAGHTNRQIAEILFIGERTVESHVARLVSKLGVANRVQAASQALAWGLTS